MKTISTVSFVSATALIGLSAFCGGVFAASTAFVPVPACGLSASPFTSNSACTAVAAPLSPPTPAVMAAVGQLLFFDTSLSASGKQSCATCHSPGNAFTAANNAPVPFGGASLSLNLQGLRNAPSTMYSSFIPRFTLTPPNAPVLATGTLHPAGGLMRDGRQPTLAAQAQQPFITSFEMSNNSSAQVLARLKSSSTLAQFIAVFGVASLNNSDTVLANMGQAIAAYEATAVMQPFSSKYDASVNGSATLTAQEQAGFLAFSDPNKGHCISCHSTTVPAGIPAQFTDFSYHNVGVPRNWAISVNNDSTILPGYAPANGAGLGAPGHNYYDMGLCGPLRTDLAGNTTLCGSFKVPTLRNVGIKQTYEHNGIFTNLQDVVSFYATRNSNPTRWYVKANGTPDILYNDLPVKYDQNIEPVNHPGGPIAPNLNATDIQNIVSFLCTLTDGYSPKNPSAYNASGQCKGL